MIKPCQTILCAVICGADLGKMKLHFNLCVHVEYLWRWVYDQGHGQERKYCMWVMVTTNLVCNLNKAKVI